MVLALGIARGVYAKWNYRMTVTSVGDGQHSKFSLHYSGSAADLRTRHLAAGDDRLIAADIRAALTGDYDVVLEGGHIHIEWDPRARP